MSLCCLKEPVNGKRLVVGLYIAQRIKGPDYPLIGASGLAFCRCIHGVSCQSV